MPITPAGATAPKVQTQPVNVKEDGQGGGDKVSNLGHVGVDIPSIQTTGTMEDFINNSPAPDEIRAALTAVVNGQITPQNFMAQYREFITPGLYTQLLNQHIANGGSAQLQAYLAIMRGMNAQNVKEMIAEQNLPPGSQSALELQLNDATALGLLAMMYGVEKLGAQPQAQTGVLYFGVDLLRDVDYDGALDPDKLKELLDPSKLANMTDAEVSAAVDDLLGPGGGSPALAAKRSQYMGNPWQLAQFDRGLLTTLATTIVTAKADPAWAKTVGMDKIMADVEAARKAENEIPPQFRGNLMAMICWVILKADKILYGNFKQSIEDYAASNDKLGGMKRDDAGYDATRNTVETQGLTMQMSKEAWSNNIAMGSRLIQDVGDTLSRIWQ